MCRKSSRPTGYRAVYFNHKINSSEDYYRVSVYAPLLDIFLTDLLARFLTEPLDVFRLSDFIPKSTLTYCPVNMTKLFIPFSIASDYSLITIRALLLFCSKVNCFCGERNGFIFNSCIPITHELILSLFGYRTVIFIVAIPQNIFRSDFV